MSPTFLENTVYSAFCKLGKCVHALYIRYFAKFLVTGDTVGYAQNKLHRCEYSEFSIVMLHKQVSPTHILVTPSKNTKIAIMDRMICR